MKRMITIFLLMLPMSLQAGLELEVDPFAFALKGYSYHVAYKGGSLRTDIGAYGLTLKKAPGNPDFELEMDAQGVKIDYLFGEGWFTGVSLGSGTLDISCPTCVTQEAQTRQFTNKGVRFGVNIGAGHWYFAPWLGVDQMSLEGDPVLIGSKTYQSPEFQLFPTIHLGYRF